MYVCPPATSKAGLRKSAGAIKGSISSKPAQLLAFRVRTYL
jgi:hypothetical protein